MAITIRDNSAGSSHRGLFASLRDPELEPHSDHVPLPAAGPKVSMWHRLGLGRWLHRDENSSNNNNNSNSISGSSSPTTDNRGYLHRRLSRKVGAVGLPRPTTFRRQNSEQRDRLAPAQPEPRRAQSADRRRTLSVQRTQSPAPVHIGRLSAPEVGSWSEQEPLELRDDDSAHEYLRDTATLSQVDSGPYHHQYDEASLQLDGVEDVLEQELEKKWILNLSMHFRDKSEREKFFVTYAEKPNRWRRVTISCDYRNAPPDSLEQDLKELHYQRDKSARIYESIQESLPEIQFYDTVTNLKLETSDGRLHVHVTEDVNEIIPYPPISSVRHLGGRLIPEYDLMFDSHLSGFVYKVQLDGKAYIKKEIPGPDTVDEFLYEINALHALYGSNSVIRFEGIIVDDHHEKVKGLLISYAEQGALVDVLYDFRGQLPLARRERWARQIVQGLCEIHEAGYVQGDFTLSNIVIDGNDNAKIIDINRRGCPVGWEPPEIAAKIASNQRISMYIGVKSDLFQLGMTLWALAMQEDEPERQPRPLLIPVDVKIPDYYRQIIAHCLSDRPRARLSAKELLAMFPPDMKEQSVMPSWSPSTNTSPPVYNSLPLDTSHSVCLDDDHRGPRPGVVYVTPAEYGHEIDYPPRGRRPSTHALPLSDYQPSTYLPSSASPNPDGRRSISQSDFEINRPSSDVRVEPRFEEVEVNGTQYLVNPDMFSAEEFEALRDNSHEPHDSQELQSGRSSNLSRAVVPSSVGDGGKDADVDRETASGETQSHEVKSGDSDEPGNFQDSSSGSRILGDIAGVGGHPLVSTDHPNIPTGAYPAVDAFDSSLEKQHAAILQPPLTKTTAIAKSHNTSSSSYVAQPQHSEAKEASSLLDSRLPINPSILQPSTVKSGRPRSLSRISYLLDSVLPINPASSSSSSVKGSSSSNHNDHETSLFSSKLPINPAIPQASTFRGGRPSSMSRMSHLFDSILPINPASSSSSSSSVKDGSGGSWQETTSLFNSRLPINPSISQIPAVKSGRRSSSRSRLSYLFDSVLPINPAAATSASSVDSSRQETSLLGSRLPINPAIPQSFAAKNGRPSSSRSRISYLFDSVLPINPAAAAPVPTKSSGQQETSLLTSKLPINPAIPQPPTAKGGRPSTSLSRISYLLDSVLPINPAASVRNRDRMPKAIN